MSKRFIVTLIAIVIIILVGEIVWFIQKTHALDVFKATQTISLLNSGIIFDVPKDFSVDMYPQNGQNGNKYGFDYINLINRQSVTTPSQSQQGGSGTGTTTTVSVIVTTGNWMSFAPSKPSQKETKYGTMTNMTDTSLVPAHNPRVTANNTVVYVFDFHSTDPTFFSSDTSIQANTSLDARFQDGKVRQTNITVFCGGPLSADASSCRAIVRGILSSLSVQEPLPTGIRDITRPGAQ